MNKPKNFNVLALRSLANDLAVCDPQWTPTIQMLRDAADELERYIDKERFAPKDWSNTTSIRDEVE